MFLVFFVVTYGILTWGLIFAAQQSINFAADEGARVALQWQGQNAMQPRAQRAFTEAQQRVLWVQNMGAGTATIAVCGNTGLLSGSGACSGNTLAADQIEVMVRYPYAASPLVPVLPGIVNILPAQLMARSSTRVGGIVAPAGG